VGEQQGRGEQQIIIGELMLGDVGGELVGDVDGEFDPAVFAVFGVVLDQEPVAGGVEAGDEFDRDPADGQRPTGCAGCGRWGAVRSVRPSAARTRSAPRRAAGRGASNPRGYPVNHQPQRCVAHLPEPNCHPGTRNLTMIRRVGVQVA